MQLKFQSIKDRDGALSRSFVADLRRCFALSTFIETGTFMGDTIASLQRDFVSLISIELSADLYIQAKRRFAKCVSIVLIQGDSADQLPQALALSKGSRSLIWLDAHYSGGATAKGSVNTPIIREIRNIKRHGRGQDVILIDDLRLFWRVEDGFLHHDSIDGYPSARAVVEELNSDGNKYDCIVLQDALVAIPIRYKSLYAVTPVTEACTELRIGSVDAGAERELENTVANAQGPELAALSEAPLVMKEQIPFGLGGHYYYFRGLIRDRAGDARGAAQDYEVARRCGIQVPPKDPDIR
jgi:hypothetical protein